MSPENVKNGCEYFCNIAMSHMVENIDGLLEAVEGNRVVNMKKELNKALCEPWDLKKVRPSLFCALLTTKKAFYAFLLDFKITYMVQKLRQCKVVKLAEGGSVNNRAPCLVFHRHMGGGIATHLATFLG